MSGVANVGAAWRAARDRFAAAGIENATLDAKLLAGHAFGLDPLGMATGEGREVLADEAERLKALVLRRLAREPVARILGEREFYGLAFGLNWATLVPRPETEQLVDLGRAALKKHPGPRILDLGTGSGCIVIALLQHLPNAEAIAVDVSADALDQAAKNAGRHGVGDRVFFRKGSWFEPVGVNESFDLIVSNPPYIARKEIDTLDPEVRHHDPLPALDGGHDGFDAFRIIATGSAAHLQPGGSIVVEHGAGQWDVVASLFGRAGFASRTRFHDLAGHDRVLLARRGDVQT